MASNQTSSSPRSQFVQLIVNFVLPIIILTKFSAPSQLGPTRAMLLALAFPVAFELFSIYKKRKISIVSLVAIGGIAITGAISLLGLSENWLAARRSIPYFAVSAAILVSLYIKRSLVDWLLGTILDMEAIQRATMRNNTQADLRTLIRQTSYAFVLLFLIIGTVSLVVTKVSISAETNTALFNSQYAHLRIIGIFYTTLPLFVGFIGIVMYVLSVLEKLTGLPMEALLKKKV